MAMPAKGKEPASDVIMAAAKMRPLLAVSKQEPVNAAIALTTDGEGLILLDKKAKPKKVLSMLRADATKAKLQLNTSSLRFGRAEVDTDYDASMVRFFVNKETPGVMRVKLIEVVKKIAYQKVEINVDPSLELEPEDDEQPQTAPTVETAPAVVPPPPPPPSHTAAALIADLQKLAPNIRAAGAVHPELRDKLQAASQSLVALIRAADLAGAADSFEDLTRLLKQAEESPGGAPQPGVTHSDAPPTTTEPTQPSETGSEHEHDQMRDFSARFLIINQDMRSYGLLKTLADPLRTAIEAAKSGSPQADALLSDLERQIAEAAGHQRLEGVQDTVKKASVSARTGVVALGKARLQLASARSTYATVRQTLEAACEQTRLSMVGDGIADEPETIAAVKAIGARVPNIETMSADVENALDAMIGTADPGARDTARKLAITAIGTYRTAVDAEPILTRMQNTPAGTFQIRDALVGALDHLEQALSV